MPRAWPRETNVPIRLPLWDSTVHRPVLSVSRAKAAFAVIDRPFHVRTRPRLLGPRTRVPVPATMPTSLRCKAWPASPASAKPSARIEIAPTPCRTQSSTAAIASSVGKTI